MDKYIDERFDRVQRALTTLIDSVTKYTPSTTQANELAQADKELSEGLHELQTHQNNYLRIQELRKEADDLDAQIKTTVSLLWNTRKEITATPTTSYPSSGPRYDFSYSDLLNYARRIARTTVPPPGVTNGVDLSAPPAEQGTSAEQTPVTAATDNPIVTNGTTTTQPQPTASADPSQPSQQTSQQTFTTALPEHMADSVNLLEGAVFYPWPGEDRIRNGALEQCQRLVNAGVDPVGYDPEEEERKRLAAREEAERREALEAEERRKREEERFARARAAALERERQRQAAAQAAAAGGEGAGAAGQSSPEARRDSKPKQFQFMGGLDDEDDD
ncbi:vitamin-D-receptor interacting mediator subunit 4-domain-containing protein [Coniochaeta sp. 2T2.1]|nr:vitamin-D-receptor interacting mediator subunit 4-domain-containing protein [Coniochaeta sp. 2T2.1]